MRNATVANSVNCCSDHHPAHPQSPFPNANAINSQHPPCQQQLRKSFLERGVVTITITTAGIGVFNTIHLLK
ncbi:hypothetical protein L873DRAFT_1813939 [Choiromyces venosus 120613-1]|uniref:Uncharacterized protein n=1 Tax=Choiromyces venosus 120613-1 TaxID=1336337 RepID=A0A3N4JLC4_9PEZI|nr:hypothetical protein L873DRAFT_1813939 [Choiromyces venosus 120613-1]